jgi:hypothetical protein
MDNQMTNDQPNKNPNEVLAEQIFQKLLDAGLVAEDGQTKFTNALAQGTLRDSDWKVALEQILFTPAHETPKT